MDSETKKMFELLLEGQKEIKKQLSLIQEKVDVISNRSLKNEQSIKHIEKEIAEEKTETKERFDLAHQSIRRRDKTLRWIATAILLPIALSILNFFNVSPK